MYHPNYMGKLFRVYCHGKTEEQMLSDYDVCSSLQITFDLAFQNQLHRLRPVCEIENRYIQFVLRQAKSQGILAQMSSGVTIQHFSATALRRFAVPLPPLSEQNLIVEKVNQLMKFCDELERGMLKKADFAEKYARSVVSASA
ncbi:MAG: restriction endonuclease subunit S [Actinobacteria bacterium]|nr:restriction endonuclease subunit S [Actinomycetota bacterium]